MVRDRPQFPRQTREATKLLMGLRNGKNSLRLREEVGSSLSVQGFPRKPLSAVFSKRGGLPYSSFHFFPLYF